MLLVKLGLGMRVMMTAFTIKGCAMCNISFLFMIHLERVVGIAWVRDGQVG